LLHALQQTLRGGRWPDLPTFTNEQAGAELFFQLANLVANGAVGDAQFSRRATKMGMPGGTFKGA
jgi:hypothetical protein